MKIAANAVVLLNYLATVGVAFFMSPAAHADVWQVTLQNAKRDAHYLVNTQTSTVTSMRSQQCVRSFNAKITNEKTATPTVTIDSDISGGGEGGGMRGTQRMVFVLREGTTEVSTSSSVRGTRPPIPATARRTCKGATCAMVSC